MGEPASNEVLQVVAGDGGFNAAGVERFVREAGLESAGVGYTVVAIMGPQSSGKSTLLNNLVSGEAGGRRGAPPSHVAACQLHTGGPPSQPRLRPGHLASLARGLRRWTH